MLIHKMTTNDVVLATGYNQFEKHFIMLNKNFKKLHFSNFNYLSQDNHNLIFKYQINGKYNNDANFRIIEIAYFNFDSKCRINSWNEVVATSKLFDINKIKVKN
ncbi:hypothetical protein fh0823_21410 [Francisella halioticida]|uniref:hypothetical protein n=1 Tax=Francisella halioticida TaxID=549298 RepID=UPI001AFA7605|nr:hypothetical protein [Francisella halioticida]BCD92002.1 hypothetical protein fh0823_21410 [Francisella halioticida]